MTSRSQVSLHKEINWVICSCTMVTSVSASNEREPPVSKAENEKENTNASLPKLDWVRCMVLMMSAFLSYAWLQDLILVSLPQWLKQRTQPSTYLCRGQAWQPLYILVSILCHVSKTNHSFVWHCISSYDMRKSVWINNYCNCSCVFIYAVRITDEIIIAGNQRNERIYK